MTLEETRLKLGKYLHQKYCEHRKRKIISFKKEPVKNIPGMTVSWSYDVETEYRCFDCGKEFIEYTRE